MPAGVADYGASTWLGVLFGLAKAPTLYWLALCTDQPGTAMDGDVLADLEPADKAYRRVRYGIGADYWAVNGNFVTNTDEIAFGVPTADWGYLNHFALCTASSGGDLYAWGEFISPAYVATDVQAVVPVGGLVVALSSLDPSIVV